MAYRVIVADDSPSVQKAVELALPAQEFEIFPFSDGLEAIQAIPSIRPEAVLASLSLPSKDGYEVAGFVRSQEGGQQVALFFLRGAFEPVELGKIALVHYDGIILEPFDGEVLAGLVKETIDRKNELPSLPEEPILEELARSGRYQRDAPPTPSGVPEWQDEWAKRIRDAVRAEIRNQRGELYKIAKEIISSEVKKVLVEELKGIDTKKI